MISGIRRDLDEICVLLGYYHYTLRNIPEEHSSHTLCCCCCGGGGGGGGRLRRRLCSFLVNKETFTWSLANYVGSSPGRPIFPAEEVN